MSARKASTASWAVLASKGDEDCDAREGGFVGYRAVLASIPASQELFATHAQASSSSTIEELSPFFRRDIVSATDFFVWQHGHCRFSSPGAASHS